MRRVTGIGGIFMSAKDPKALCDWYKKHLGIDVQDWGGAAFTWTDSDGNPTKGTTIWSVGPAEGTHFAPSKSTFIGSMTHPNFPYSACSRQSTRPSRECGLTTERCSAMSQAKCPHCGFGFDNQRSAGPERLRGRLLYGPERLIAKAKLDGASFDICPNCGNRFPSQEFVFFGEFARAKLRSMGSIYAVAGIFIVVLAISIWLGGK